MLEKSSSFIQTFLEVENMGSTPKIQWKTLKRSITHSCFDGRYNLCLEEKIQIMLYFDPSNLLNQRCNLIARYKHKINLDYFQK